MADNKEFRSDLMYRLQIGSVRMPPLRERVGDVHRLAHHFIGCFARQYTESCKTLDAESLRRLEGHDWPGNVRELENVIHREFILNDFPVMRIGDIHFSRNQPTEQSGPRLFSALPHFLRSGFPARKRAGHRIVRT